MAVLPGAFSKAPLWLLSVNFVDKQGLIPHDKEHVPRNNMG